MSQIYRVDASYKTVYIEADEFNDAARIFVEGVKQRKVYLTDVKAVVVSELPKGEEFLR